MRRGVVTFGAFIILIASIMIMESQTEFILRILRPGIYRFYHELYLARTRNVASLVVGSTLLVIGLIVFSVGLRMTEEPTSPGAVGTGFGVFGRPTRIIIVGLSHFAAAPFPNSLKLALLTASLATVADYLITLYAILTLPWGSVREENRIVIFLSSLMPAPLALTLTFLCGTLSLLSLFLLVRRKLKEPIFSGTVLSFFKRLRSTATLWDLLFLVILGAYIGTALLHLFALFVNWRNLITFS